jgi:hypothetical protein
VLANCAAIDSAYRSIRQGGWATLEDAGLALAA